MIENDGGFVSLFTCKRIAKEKNVSFRAVEEEIFQAGLTPKRFEKNQNSISQAEQYKLFNASVAIVGCGGLGGNMAELLSRVGIGKLLLIDNDVFSESNLNRQKFSSLKSIGKYKVDVISQKLQDINPALLVKEEIVKVCKDNVSSLLSGYNVVADCVDNAETKRLLASFCRKDKAHFVHGAIGGWMSQNSTSTKMGSLYEKDEAGAEKMVGNLSFSASLCASMQAALCLKLILGKIDIKDELYMYNLLDDEFTRVLL